MDIPSLALAFGVAWTPLNVPTPRAVPAADSSAAPIVMIDAQGAARGWQDAVADLATARVIAVGEGHDNAAHHLIQAEVLAALAARVPRLAVAFEMVTFEQQPVLDAFMSGRMAEKEFAAWWKKHWGYDYFLYKPIFDAAKSAAVPAYGINAPLELVKAVSKNGLASLSRADRARLPSSIRESSDARYRDFVKESLGGHGPLPPEKMKNRLEAMAVWNETMGEKAAALAAAGHVVVVIVGGGHVYFKGGVPESAARRAAGPVKVLLPLEQRPQGDALALADWFRLVPNVRKVKATAPDDLWLPLR
ncbi:MAG: ChaN family lipoprotein [Elusimicrobiota bacterium]